jgi:hypothetical protein
MLRYMEWLCFRDNTLNGSQIYVVTGTRVDLAIMLVNRSRMLIPTIGFVTKETVVELSGAYTFKILVAKWQQHPFLP